MRVGSLFTGIGGLDLGLERAGFTIAWQVEIDPHCTKVLYKQWREVPKYGDIRTAGKHNLEWVDLIVGGFPCQDISSAGNRAGIEGERSGLWKEQARIIGEIRPRYVLIENVAALLYGGKTCNGEQREAAIATVLRDLAAIGYDAEWRVLSAAEFGAPHLRKRVFIVAYDPRQRGRAWRAEPARQQGQTNADRRGTALADAAGTRRKEQPGTTGIHAGFNAYGSAMADANGHRHRGRSNQSEPEPGCGKAANIGMDGEQGTMADATGTRPQERDGYAGTQSHEWRGADNGGERPIESRLDRVFDGLSDWLDGCYQWPAGPGEQHEWEPPRVITGKLKDRVARLKGLGNAALPQIAEAIGHGVKRHAREVQQC